MFDRCYLIAVMFSFLFYYYFLGLIPETVLIAFFTSLGCRSFFLD